MAEQQEPDNINAANTSASNQHSSPDWNTVSNLIGSAITNAANISAPTKQKRDWIPIINLILTFIIAIGGVVGGYWVSRSLNAQNEQINKELDIFSNNLQFARLEVSCGPVCNQDAGIEVKNDGPGTATNVVVTILMINVGNLWKSRIKDIQAFQPFVVPLSIPRVVAKTTLAGAAIPNADVLNNNAYNITLDSITPQETVYINLSPDLRKLGSVDTLPARFDFQVFTDKPLPDTNSESDYFVVRFLGIYFKMADFLFNATCNICKGDTSYNSSINPTINDITMIDSFAERQESTVSHSSAQPQEWDGTVAIRYFLPKGLKLLVPHQMYFQIRNTGTSHESITSCKPPKCTDFSKIILPSP
jgi:hypothetical protein